MMADFLAIVHTDNFSYLGLLVPRLVLLFDEFAIIIGLYPLVAANVLARDIRVFRMLIFLA